MSDSIDIQSFQAIIDRTFGAKDAERGLAGTFVWFVEEVGELARALKRREPDRANLEEEFSDVLAWLTTLASLADIDMRKAARRYMDGCPRCGAIPCACDERSRFNEAGGPGSP